MNKPCIGFRNACLVSACCVGVLELSAATAAEDDYARQLVALVNQYRESHDRPALTVDGTIGGLAREHSLDMSKSGRLNHDGFPFRVKRSGRAMCVENVGWNQPSARSQFDAWRASPGHDHNMLDPRVDRIGIGFAGGYVTMIACGK
jgi:uncharacterized protein YkwD